jgi:hypothetical protein
MNNYRRIFYAVPLVKNANRDFLNKTARKLLLIVEKVERLKEESPRSFGP